MNQKINLKFISNYSNDKDLNNLLQKFLIKGVHDNITISVDNPDYYVIINHPFYQNKKQYYENDKTVYIYNEPESSRKTWDVWKLKETFLYDNKANWKHYDLDYNINDFINKPIRKELNNLNKLTCVTTDLMMLEGHRLRMNFLPYLDRYLPQFDIEPVIYGRKKTGLYDRLNLKHYHGDCNKRDELLFPYYYHFMAENTKEKNYLTEKILDPILTETLCFYWGCPNIKNYLHEKSFICVDLEKPNKALEIIVNSIKNNEYEKRLKYIKESKKKVIYELNPITLIQNNIIESTK